MESCQYKSSPCGGGSRFPLSLFEWSFTICVRSHPTDRTFYCCYFRLCFANVDLVSLKTVLGLVDTVWIGSVDIVYQLTIDGEATRSSMVRAFVHGAIGRRIDPS